MKNNTRLILGIFSGYYILTGLWPLISYSTFEAVTGPKTDVWLVHIVGLLVIMIGVTYAVAFWKRNPIDPVLLTLIIGSALAFTAIDIWYVAAGEIRAIYVGDAVVEIALTGAVIWSLRESNTNNH